jgi:uroporphyrin-3 C-methyltransferase
VQKLYDLYGRDENGWKLAEVEYLMSVAQHKLVLQNDFAGAAKTLDAANKRIAELADPGLLPVRSLISEEIALLKTRVRPDLAGMTLTLGRLTRQVASLDTVYVGDTEAKNSTPTRYAPDSTVGASELPLEQRARQFLTSLFTIKRVQTPAAPVGVVSIPEVKQTLEDNLKLTRWALLERDAMQYQRLMQANLRLFAEYFDPDDAANAEFHQELVDLSKTSLRPEIPDIGGSLRLLQQIQAKREQIEQAQEAEHG